MPTLEDALLKLKIFIEYKDLPEIIENLSTILISKEIDYKLIDFIRKKQLSPTPFDLLQDNLDNATVNIQSDLPDPEESLINRQKIAALKDIVSQLKPRYKALIELRYYKEYSYEEISSELNLPIGTVKAQLYRAKSLLYNILIKTGNR